MLLLVLRSLFDLVILMILAVVVLPIITLICAVAQIVVFIINLFRFKHNLMSSFIPWFTRYYAIKKDVQRVRLLNWFAERLDQYLKKEIPQVKVYPYIDTNNEWNNVIPIVENQEISGLIRKVVCSYLYDRTYTYYIPAYIKKVEVLGACREDQEYRLAERLTWSHRVGRVWKPNLHYPKNEEG